MSKGGEVNPSSGGPRGDYGDPAFDAGTQFFDPGVFMGSNTTAPRVVPEPTGGKGGAIQPLPISQPVYQPLLGGSPPLGGYFAQYMNQMQQPYMPQQYAPQAGSIVDPTVNAAFDVLNRAPVQRALPELRGSGVSFDFSDFTFDKPYAVGNNTAPLVPETPYRTADYTRTPAAAPTVSSGDSGGYQDTVDNSAWSNMTDAEKAAYYAENPTVGSIGRTINSVVENSLPGQIAGYFDPGGFTRSDAILAGMDPTGWQFAERQSDGLLGTQIGGSLTFPELTPENFGPYAFPETNAPAVGNYVAEAPDPYAGTWLDTPEALAWANTPAVAPVMTGGSINTPSVPSYSDSMAAVANLSSDPMGALIDQITAPAVPATTTVPATPTSDSVSAPAGAPTGGYVTDGRGNIVTSGDGTAFTWGTGAPSYTPTENERSFAATDGYTADVPSASAGGYDPTSGYDTDTDSGGDSGGSSKIVCTAMNHAYGFGSFRNRIWLAYAAKNLTAAHEKGYHALFLPLVDIAYRKQTIVSKPLRAVLENIARHRSADLRAEMRNQKRDLIGRAYRFVLEPLCYAVGKLKGY